MPNTLITTAQRAELLVNGARSARGATIDPPPVVKLFTPDAGATWLLTELDPADPDRLNRASAAERAPTWFTRTRPAAHAGTPIQLPPVLQL